MNSYFESLLEPERKRTKFWSETKCGIFFVWKKRKIEIYEWAEDNTYWLKTNSFSLEFSRYQNEPWGLFDEIIQRFCISHSNLKTIHFFLSQLVTFKKKNFILRLDSSFFLNIMPFRP
jgi:hypothetical protein